MERIFSPSEFKRYIVPLLHTFEMAIDDILWVYLIAFN